MRSSILIAMLSCVLSMQAQHLTEIRMLQDRRVIGSAELAGYLRASDAGDREAALLAVANIQDTSMFEQVVPLLSDNEPRVRSMAAFAVGMMGRPKSAWPMFRRLAVEREESCVPALFNAIGMCGTTDDLRSIVAQKESYPEEWNNAVALALERFAVRRVKDAGATKLAIALLDDRASLLNACYAVTRGADTVTLRKSAPRLQRLLNNPSPIIRMWGASITGMLGDTNAVSKLMVMARSDKDWRVRVNAVRALRTTSSAAPLFATLLLDPNAHVAQEAVQSMSLLTNRIPELWDSTIVLSALHNTTALSPMKEELKRLAAQRMGARAIPFIGRWDTTVATISAQRIRALGETRSSAALPAIKAAMNTARASLVTIAALEAYGSIASGGSIDVQRAFLDAAAASFSRKDAGISYSAAVAFQDTAFAADLRQAMVPRLNAVFLAMSAPADLEPMVELLKVFEALADTAALPSVRKGMGSSDAVIAAAARKAFAAMSDEEIPDTAGETVYAPFFSAADFASLSRYSGAEVNTGKGKIRLQFDTTAAPLTVLNFILLTKKGFFNGLSFHRVVGNFVVQGGDPLGNGSGGPNYSLRTEVHPAALYRAGAVGMASAGKDTEGSQWFITHCPTPHLDFRYTVFAYTKDQAVVDRIMVGDPIVSVTLF